jgi:hypothetical protein
MDSESCNRNEEDKQTENGDHFSNDRSIFKSFWLRRTSGVTHQINRLLLECELGIILPCGILLWTIFLIFK